MYILAVASSLRLRCSCSQNGWRTRGLYGVETKKGMRVSDLHADVPVQMDMLEMYFVYDFAQTFNTSHYVPHRGMSLLGGRGNQYPPGEIFEGYEPKHG